jgi:hypothetical protein
MLKHIAQDYLAIQGSVTPLERAFSSGGVTGTLHRGALSTDTFEALQILKSAYQNGHVAAADEASKHKDALIAGFDEDEDCNDGIIEIL